MIRTFLVTALLAGVASAQSASSTFVLPAGELGQGGSTTSSNWKLTASLGDGAVATRTSSAGFTLTGGFAAALAAGPSGEPFVMATRPLYGPLLGGTALTLHGTELHVGSSAAVAIGGKSTPVTTRSRARIVTSLPAQTAPGWASVEVTAGGATSTVRKGVGVLPMLDGEPPCARGAPFDIEFRGTQHDLTIWMVALSTRMNPLSMPPLHYEYRLDLASMFVVTAAPVTHASGVLQLRVPGLRWGPRVFFQALVLSDTRGYLPGSFTNVIAR